MEGHCEPRHAAIAEDGDAAVVCSTLTTAPQTRLHSGGPFMRRMLYGLLVVLAALLLHVPTVAAQVDRAALTGTVKDTSNAVVPGATVTARNAATNVPAVSVTDTQGTYVIGGLIPGSYVVDVELSGFKKSTGNLNPDVG